VKWFWLTIVISTVRLEGDSDCLLDASRILGKYEFLMISIGPTFTGGVSWVHSNKMDT
jgi:hypothetical protein